MYGMGKGKLAAQLDISPDEAGELIGNNTVRRCRSLRDLQILQVNRQKTGQIRTHTGRRCRFHLWEPSHLWIQEATSYEEAMKEYGQPLKRAFTYKALNKLIQGSAADQTKKLWLIVIHEGLFPMLTVHDELCFSVEGDDRLAESRT